MKIITYAKDKNVISEIEEILKQLPIKYKLVNFNKFKPFLEVYNQTKFDYIIADIDSISTKKMRRVLDYICSINEEQKIIKISNSFNCNIAYGCRFCSKEYNNTILTKPISSQDMIYALSESYCCKSIDKPLQKKIKKIESKFDSFQFDVLTGMFMNKNSFLNGRDKSLEKITKHLTKEDISFEVDNLSNIKIN